MFKFLKDKLKNAVAGFSKKVDEETEELPEEEIKEEDKKKEQPKEKPAAPAEPEEKKEEPEKPKEEGLILKEEPIEEKKKPEEHAPDEEPEPEPEKEEQPEEKKKPEEEKKEEPEEKPEIKEKPKVEEKEEIKHEPEYAQTKSGTPQGGKKGFFGRIKEKFVSKVEFPEEPEEEPEEKPTEKEPVKAKSHVEEEKSGFLGKVTEKVTKKVVSEQKFDELFYELEIALMENNVAVEVIEKIKKDLKKQLVGKPLTRSKIQDIITNSLKNSIEDLFIVKQIDILQKIKEKKPFIILFVGINGSGKTTTIAKIVKLLQNNKLKPVIAAADTFRAAAIQQLETHANKLKVKMIKHDYGADPAAVAFDAIKYAEAHKLDAVLIDTAGRLHSNVNLIDELKKIVRVSKPDMKIFVGESITGNDCVEQARKFNEAIGIDAIILAKADVDEKGGAAISVSYVTNKPIIFLGTGQNYEDLQPFSSEVIINSLGLSA